MYPVSLSVKKEVTGVVTQMEIRIRYPGSKSVDTKNFTDYTTRYFTVEL